MWRSVGINNAPSDGPGAVRQTRTGLESGCGVRRKPAVPTSRPPAPFSSSAKSSAAAPASWRKPYVPPERRSEASGESTGAASGGGGGSWFSAGGSGGGRGGGGVTSTSRSSMSVNGSTFSWGDGGPAVDMAQGSGAAAGVLVPLLVGAGAALLSEFNASRSSSSVGEDAAAHQQPSSQSMPQQQQPQPRSQSNQSMYPQFPAARHFVEENQGPARVATSRTAPPSAAMAEVEAEAPPQQPPGATPRAALNTLRRGMGRRIAAAIGGTATPYRGRSQSVQDAESGSGGASLHSIASSWVGARASSAPAVATALSPALGEGEDSSAGKGGEIMRAVMSTPDADPRPVPLSYLRACTDDFSDGRKIGEGAFSRVYEGKDRAIRRKFAVKRLRVRLLFDDADLEEARNTFEREIATLTHFRHPNIARMYAYYISPDLRGDHCLVYDLASNGSLHDALRSKRKVHWTTRINIALDIARALEYLHAGRGGQICYHRDVKSANVCLRRNYTALLIDCGISKMIPDGDGGSGGEMTMTIMDSVTGNGARGTPGYICPSFSRRMGRFASANDVFSLGVVLAEIFTGLLQNADGVDMFDRYSPDGDGERDLERDVEDNDVAGEWGAAVRGDFAGLTVECLRQKPEKRPAIGEIVQRLGVLASKSRPRSPGERNHITVLSSAPLVYADAEGKLRPLPKSPNFALERDQLVACIKESRRDITLTFDTATDDRLLAAATRRCGCLHFSGHGHPGHLLFEDGKGGAHWIGEEKLYDSVHTQPFKFAFVSACYSQLLGEALIKAGVPHVVCCEHDQELRDDAAMKFTHTFYYALAEGYTVKDAFKKGKMAVDRRFHDAEASKFMLLPEDGDHDTPLFDAQHLEWNDEKVGAESAMPLMPRTLLRRELEVYSLLQLILNGRLVNLVGDAGIGCSSVALEVGNYIRDRRSSMIGIDAVYYIRRDEVDDRCDPEIPLRRMYETLVKDGSVFPLSAKAESTLTERLVEALSGMSVLIIFDRVESDDSVLLNSVANVLERSSACRVLLISRARLDISSVSEEGQTYNLGRLGLEDAAQLFGEACRHTNSHAAQNVWFDKIVGGGLVPNSHLSEVIAGGNPGRIIECAKSMSKEAYVQLLE